MYEITKIRKYKQTLQFLLLIPLSIIKFLISLLLLIALELPTREKPNNQLKNISDQQNNYHDDLNKQHIVLNNHKINGKEYAYKRSKHKEYHIGRVLCLRIIK